MENKDKDIPGLKTGLESTRRRARTGLLSYMPDLKAAGVTEGEVLNAARIAEDRVGREFQRKNDQFSRISNVLEVAAKAPEEKLLAQQGIKALNELREGLDRSIYDSTEQARYKGKPITIEDIFQTAKILYPDMYIEKRQNMKDGGIRYYLTVSVLHTIVPDHAEDDGETIDLNPDFTERVLKGLGVLQPGQSLDALRLLPREIGSGDRGYFNDFLGADRVPTNIPGVDVRVDLTNLSVDVSMDLQTLDGMVGVNVQK